MIGHITNSGGNNSLMKHDVVQGNNIVDLDLLRNFNGVTGLNRDKGISPFEYAKINNPLK
ncbi:Prophage integrase [Shigella sonnei]|nr:Prophage integrase [Shigella sonnei]